MSEEIIDLDVISPPKRLIKIKGREIDISVIPFKISLELMKHSNEFSKLGEMIKDESINDESQGGYVATQLETMFTVTKDILKNADPAITDEWIDKNISSNQAILLINRIVDFINDELGEPKKAPKPQPES